MPTALAQHAAAPQSGNPIYSTITEDVQPQFIGTIQVDGSNEQPSLRGPAPIMYDSFTGCAGGYTRLTVGPAALFDDGSFTPGPAGGIGATITSMTVLARPIVALPTIIIRITVYNTVIPAGAGVPAVVQADQITQQFATLTGTAVNTTPGLYQVNVDVIDFVIPDDDWGIEIAFVDANGAILPNGQITTSFPANACVATHPVVGSNAEIWWVDNDLGTIVGDGIRYEPYDAAQANINQGDAIAWGGATPADNSIGMIMRGNILDPTFGACCAGESCTFTDLAGCDALGGTFSLQTPCSAFFCVAPPANDDCLTAQVISGFGQFSYDNRAATTGGEAAPTCTAPQNITEDVWFRWTSPCTGSVSLATCLINTTDDAVAVYQGSNCGDLNTQVACDDDGCGVVGGQFTATFDVTQGTTYLLRVGTWNNAAGGQNFFDLTNNSCTGGPAFCDADWCQDGAVGVPDIFCFLSAWFANDPIARNYGGTAGVPAIFAFLSIWFATGQGPCTP